MQSLLLASSNPGKIHEIRTLLEDLCLVLVTPTSLGKHLQIVEDGSTYAENASRKAIAYTRATGLITLADDSGLEVNGVAEDVGTPGIDPGWSTVTMQATGNWFLQIRGENLLPTSAGATGSIPIDNVGVWCEAMGIHQFGVEVTSNYTMPNAALGILSSDQILINLYTGNSNAGSPDDNRFRLHWLMGTKQGTMRQESMFTQLSDGDFSKGTFETEIVLTMTEIP